MRVTFRPAKYLSVGVSGGFRSQKGVPRPSKNLRTNLTYSRIPILKLSATASATLLQSAFLDGRIFGLRLSREIIKGKVSGSAIYRNVHYQYLSSESILNQHIAGVTLSWRIQKKLSLSLSFEGTFEKKKRSDRIRLNLIKRFRS